MQSTIEKPSISDVQDYLNLAKFKPWEWLPMRYDIPFWHEGMTRMCRGAVQAIAENKPLVIGSGHAQSKDYLMGRLALWFCEVYGPCVVVLTAPTGRQVRNIMWAELTQAYNTRRGQDDGFGKLFKTKFEIAENHYIIPFTTKDSQSQGIGKFQGFHSPRVMVVFSEAQAIADEVYDQVDGVLTGEINLFVCIGNPLRSTGRYAQMLKNPKNNVIVTLDATKSPNYLAKKIVIPGMSTYEWVEDKRRKWGEDDPRWYGKVLGLVPPTGLNNVFPDIYYTQAQKRILHYSEEKCIVACDVATGGEDDCEIIGIRNWQIVAHKTLSGSILPDKVAQEMVIMKHDISANGYAWDANGPGEFLGPLLKRLDPAEEVYFYGFKGSEQAENPDMYQNNRAETHFFCRQKMIDGHVVMPGDDDGGWNDKLKEELQSLEWFENKRGRIQIIDKDDIKEALGRSPNAAEAWMIGIRGMENAPTTRQTQKAARKRGKWDEEESEGAGFMGG
jgi:hypothetical protein